MYYCETGRPGSSDVPRNPLTRWDVSSIPANGIFLTKKLKNKIKTPNGWRTIKKIVRPSFMGIVFGVYRNWIGEFGDLKSDTPILWGSIWPNTIISNPIFYFFPRLHRIWNPNTMESRTIVFAVFDLTCRRVPLKVRSHHQA